MPERTEGNAPSGERESSWGQPLTFEKFVAIQKITPEQRAVWSERQQAEAYKSYLQFFGMEQAERRKVYSTYVQHFYTNPNKRPDETRLLSFEEWEKSNYKDEEAE